MGIAISTKKYKPIPLDKDDTINVSGISYKDGVLTVPMEAQKFQHKKVLNASQKYREYDNGNVV